jgi:hypothetical protein
LDEAVRRWRQTGAIYFWIESDKRQGGGWHFAADERGKDDIDTLVGLAKNARFPSRFTLTPDPVSGPTRRSARKVTLSHNAKWAPSHWNLHEIDGALTIELGSSRLAELSAVVADLRKGGADYTFGGEPAIWAWWAAV